MWYTAIAYGRLHSLPPSIVLLRYVDRLENIFFVCTMVNTSHQKLEGTSVRTLNDPGAFHQRAIPSCWKDYTEFSIEYGLLTGIHLCMDGAFARQASLDAARPAQPEVLRCPLRFSSRDNAGVVSVPEW